MNDFYNSSELFVFPSRYGFGLSALEAMACGVPTIVGKTLDAKDFFTDKDMFVDPDNIDEISKKIVYFLKNKNASLEKSKYSIKFSRAHSWNKVFSKYLSDCKRLA